jgi:hypothetical protein
MLEAIHSSETLILTRATWHHIPEDGILDSKVACYALFNALKTIAKFADVVYLKLALFYA